MISANDSPFAHTKSTSGDISNHKKDGFDPIVGRMFIIRALNNLCTDNKNNSLKHLLMYSLTTKMEEKVRETDKISVEDKYYIKQLLALIL